MKRWILGQFTRAEALVLLFIVLSAWIAFTMSGIGGPMLPPANGIAAILGGALILRIGMTWLTTRFAPPNRKPEVWSFAASQERWTLAVMVLFILLANMRPGIFRVGGCFLLPAAAGFWIFDGCARILLSGWNKKRTIGALTVVLIGALSSSCLIEWYFYRGEIGRLVKCRIGNILEVNDSGAGPYVLIADENAVESEKWDLAKLAQKRGGSVVYHSLKDLPDTVSAWAGMPVTLAIAVDADFLTARFVRRIVDALRIENHPIQARLGFLPLCGPPAAPRYEREKKEGKPGRALIVLNSRNVPQRLKPATSALVRRLRGDGVASSRLVVDDPAVDMGERSRMPGHADLLVFAGQSLGHWTSVFPSETKPTPSPGPPSMAPFRGTVIIDGTPDGVDISHPTGIARRFWKGRAAAHIGFIKGTGITGVSEALPALYTAGLSTGETWRRLTNILNAASDDWTRGPVFRYRASRQNLLPVLIGDPAHVPFPLAKGEKRNRLAMSVLGD